MTEENSDKQTLLEFPCAFPIKAVGKNHDEFPQLVHQLVKTHLEEGVEAALKVRPSRAGQYLSVTVTIEAQSQLQLDNIYRDLSDCKEVIMAL